VGEVRLWCEDAHAVIDAEHEEITRRRKKSTSHTKIAMIKQNVKREKTIEEHLLKMAEDARQKKRHKIGNSKPCQPITTPKQSSPSFGAFPSGSERLRTERTTYHHKPQIAMSISHSHITFLQTQVCNF
jgi:hypothetical protein